MAAPVTFRANRSTRSVQSPTATTFHPTIATHRPPNRSTSDEKFRAIQRWSRFTSCPPR